MPIDQVRDDHSAAQLPRVRGTVSSILTVAEQNDPGTSTHAVGSGQSRQDPLRAYATDQISDLGGYVVELPEDDKGQQH